MKVFLSWSGERSKAVAYLLDDWLQSVIQSLQPWISDRDIERGAMWFNEIGDQLQDVKAGIVCVTGENKEKPWILFEAGALARGLRSQRVITFLVDVEKSDVRPPLGEFNHTQPNRADMWHLVRTLNALLTDSALKDGRLIAAFEKYWPDFEARFAKVLEDHPTGVTVAPRPEGEKLDEILQHMRGMESRIRRIEESTRSPFVSSGPGFAKVFGETDMDESRAKDILLAKANRIAKHIRNKAINLTEGKKMCEIEGVPVEYLDLALCGAVSPFDGLY